MIINALGDLTLVLPMQIPDRKYSFIKESLDYIYSDDISLGIFERPEEIVHMLLSNLDPEDFMDFDSEFEVKECVILWQTHTKQRVLH